MAKTPKCCSCRHCNWIKMICKFYNYGIPTDIMNETKPCEHYTAEKYEIDEDLPIAKGK